MKNIFKKSIIIVTAFAMYFSIQSCDSFLEEKAFDTFTPQNFPQTINDAEAMVNDIYLRLGNAYGNRYFWFQILHAETGNTRRTGNDRRARIDNFDSDDTSNGSEMDYLANYWEDHYEPIKQANAVIGFLQDTPELDPDAVASLVAQSKVLRATAYFNLATLIGGVPMPLDLASSREDTEVPVSELSDVYAQIIKDLEEAEPDLPHSYESTADQGRVTKGAARAMLGRVYLQRAMDPKNVAQDGDLAAAESWLKMVYEEQDGGFAYILEPEYFDLWAPETTESAKFSDEIIYQIWRDNACCANGFHQHIAPRRTPFGSVQWGNIMGEVPFYLTFEDIDERFHVTFLDTIVNADGDSLIYDVNDPQGDNVEHQGPPIAKWVDPASTNAAGGNSIFVIRKGGLIVELAEAIFRQDGATQEVLDLLNEVRARSGATLLELSDVDLEAIYDEHRWETAFEGHDLTVGMRFFDIFEARVEAAPNYVVPPPASGEVNGRQREDAVPEVPIDVTLNNLRYPIPDIERLTNPALSVDSGS